MHRTFLLIGAVLGFLSVAAGAFGAPALEARLTPERLATWDLAARYQIYHALALVALAALAPRSAGSSFDTAGWLFTAGVVVFSGTLYALALGGPRWLGAVTPLGGLLLLAGWAALAVTAARA